MVGVLSEGVLDGAGRGEHCSSVCLAVHLPSPPPVAILFAQSVLAKLHLK